MTTTMDHVAPPESAKEQPKTEQKPGPNGSQQAQEKSEKKRLSPATRLALIGGVALLGLAAAAYWYHGTFFEDTDDAQIDGYISSLAPRVSGTVTAVRVDDNQTVSPNQVLVELDPTDLRIARDQAKAALAQADAQLRAEQSNASVTEITNETLVATSSSDVASGQAGVAEAQQSVAQASAQIKQAEADAQLAQTERERAAQLFQTGAIARAEYDSRVAAADAAAAKLEAQREGVEAARRRVEEEAAKAHAASSRLKEAKQTTRG
jgi:membrane fusion protein (multidrug efflux system)